MSIQDEEKKTIDPNDEDKKEGDDIDLGDEEDKDEDDDDKGEDEDLDKPVTKKDLLDFRKGINSEINNRFAGKRHDQKSAKTYSKDSNKSKEDDPIDSRLSALEINSAKINFATQHGLSGKEVEYVWKFTGGKPTAKSLEDPFLKGGLESLRTSNNLKDNMSKGSGASTFEVEGKKWDDLKPEEKQANFGAKQKAILANKK